MDDLTRLVEIERIQQLKYRYFRYLDGKEWDELAQLFVEDARSSYGDGKYSFQGRDAILRFLRDALGRPTILSAHHGHHPEIELTSATSARGTWALWDRVIDLQHGIEISGAAFYHDEYVKIGGDWKFLATGYQRTYEELAPRPADGPAKLSANRFAKG